MRKLSMCLLVLTLVVSIIATPLTAEAKKKRVRVSKVKSASTAYLLDKSSRKPLTRHNAYHDIYIIVPSIHE